MIPRLLHSRALKRWRSALGDSATIPLGRLARTAAQAREAKAPLDALIQTAEDRLSRRPDDDLHAPRDADWAWRPEAWRAALADPALINAPNGTQLGEQVTLYHDCATPELALRQTPNRGADDRAPYGLTLETFGFDGSFLSLAIGLPTDMLGRTTRGNLIRLTVQAEVERDGAIYARLNVRHGPNTEQVLQQIPGGDGLHWVEFDLATTEMDERRLERMWIDLIFEAADMNRITMRDLTLARLPRAEM
ncbi:MAG: DUF6478 family protein [Shimia sp.]